MFDTTIRNGTIVDGTGGPPRRGDVAISDGRIVEVGTRITGPARRTIDADGHLVTPGFIDVHTHYDGQVTWDDQLEPSASNGVTTVVMGNCGVGFAPARASDTDALIDLMEGVEDIPGTALSDGMPWGAWETFGEYLDVIDARRYATDVAAQLPHGALRFYVMGERGAANEDATADDLVEMARLTEEAFAAGAVGFTTSRTIGHRSRSGSPVPGTFAPPEELEAIAEAVGRAGHGVIEAIVAGTIGLLPSLGGERAKPLDEVPMLERLSTISGRPVTFTVAQLFEDPDHWRLVMDEAAAANERGADLRPQCIPRSVTIMTSLDTYHMFMNRPAYRAIADLPLSERVIAMRDPEVRRAILSDDAGPDAVDLTDNLTGLFRLGLPLTFSLAEPVDYEPSFDDSMYARAQALGVDPIEFMYDRLLDGDGTAFYAVLGSNFVGGNLDTCREMMLAPHSVTGLSDAGAHVNLISDCSVSTFHLSHWCRDRHEEGRLPVELMVHKMTGGNADLYGFADRGRIAPGMRADLNVIDLPNLTIHAPELRWDLPTGASRIVQRASGYRATIVDGVVVREDDVDTGERPGRLIRGAAA